MEEYNFLTCHSRHFIWWWNIELLSMVLTLRTAWGSTISASSAFTTGKRVIFLSAMAPEKRESRFILVVGDYKYLYRVQYRHFNPSTKSFISQLIPVTWFFFKLQIDDATRGKPHKIRQIRNECRQLEKQWINKDNATRPIGSAPIGQCFESESR